MTDHAAGLTYYALLSLFPGLLFIVAVLGLFGGQGLITDATDYLRTAGAPQATVDATSTSLRRRKLRPFSISNTTLSARRAASSTPVVP